ncbi:hypothetical protein ASG43_12765 [Aureimonas sp. Leaf454]|uniref:hypothetical protein n=1 Tax=Aureimonas sp. Leaf454 TaxID=1736381 RepID=UPI0006F4AFBA|nr:hypothetical protein [Aureimonas sp. Leaf454]KQT45159.1 hypothetical protein ASG43_12765 [Aureimonas sp. Leaf454]
MIPIEQRASERVATRLKPGKLLTVKGGFLADCAITDRSATGARVRIFGSPRLPSDLILFDETGTVAWPTHLAWDRGTEAGLQFLAGPLTVPPEIVHRIAGPYYAVTD